MEKHTVLLVEIGEAARINRQFIRILDGHREEAGLIVQAVCVEDADPDTLTREIRRHISRCNPLILVIACGGQVAPVLPALGLALGRDAGVLWAISKIRDSEMATKAFRSGFGEYLVPPLREVIVWPMICRHLDWQPWAKAMSGPRLGQALLGIIGQSRALLEVLAELPAVANSDLSVLITGETGTGKEVCAKAMHEVSARRSKPFNPINCASLPLELMESELFGHESGAFTGARRKHVGIISKSEGGTLFLDEIDSLTVNAQVKLLRFLEDGEFRPLGAATLRKADVRIITATNANLLRLVEQKRFRADVLYRLDTMHLHLPPLREREGDVPLLVNHFLKRIGERTKGPIPTLSVAALEKLTNYHWPGNVRQLKNIISRAFVRCSVWTGAIEPAHVDLPNSTSTCESLHSKSRCFTQRFERELILELLAASGGNITKAANKARMDRRQFARKMKQLGITIPPNASGIASGSNGGNATQEAKN